MTAEERARDIILKTLGKSAPDGLESQIAKGIRDAVKEERRRLTLLLKDHPQREELCRTLFPAEPGSAKVGAKWVDLSFRDP